MDMQDKGEIGVHPITNIWFSDTDNIGDLACAPSDYFDFGQPVKRMHVMDITSEDRFNHVILGGGGMCFDEISEHLKDIRRQTLGKLIVWGVGHNDTLVDGKWEYPEWVHDADVVGIRDWDKGLPWCPCASCMHPIFDLVGEHATHDKYDELIVRHKDCDWLVGKTQTVNDHGNICTMVDLMGSAKKVVTNTYHGAYWSMMAKVPAVCVMGWSSKFQAMRKGATLGQCREANLNMYHRVMEAIS